MNARTSPLLEVAQNVFSVIARVSWVIGPILVVVAFGLISTVAYSSYFYVAPVYFEQWSLPWFLTATPGFWILYNLLFNYYAVVATDAGRPPAVSAEEARAAAITPQPDPRAGEGFSTFCKKCDRPKPPRAHHCHICGTCVLAMDHHCPWTTHCIGFFNYRYFILFLAYLWLGCIYAALLAGLPQLTYGPEETPFLPLRITHPNHETASWLQFQLLICLSVGFSVSALFFWHVYLVLTAQTTIEFYFNKSAARRMRLRGLVFFNEYDLGAKRNFESVFGKGSLPLRWLLPTFERRAGDGVVYPTTATAHLHGRGGAGDEHVV